MRRSKLLLLALAIAAPAAAQQQSLGVFGLWGAFAAKSRCYAISEPLQPRRDTAARAFASVGWFPAQGVKGQLHIRFPETKRQGSAVLLRRSRRRGCEGKKEKPGRTHCRAEQTLSVAHLQQKVSFRYGS